MTITYADKPWVQNYDEGVPASLQPYPEQANFEFLRDSAKKFPGHVALVSSTRLPIFGRKANEMTYGELDSLSDAFGAGLVDMGLKKGDKVAIVMPNIMQFVIAYYGILKAGGVVVANNPTYPPDKMAYQMNDSDARFCITMSLFYNMVLEIQPKTKIETIIVTNVKEYLHPIARTLFTLTREKKDGHAIEKRPEHLWFQDVLKKYAGQRPNVDVKHTDIAMFQYTGGTTGVSKAVMATHHAINCNILMCRAALGSDNPQEDSQLAAIPLFHVYGMVVVMGFGVACGSKLFLVPNARDIEDVMDTIHTFRPTLFGGVPALYNGINNHPKALDGTYDLTSLRACLSGSAPLPPSTKAKFEEISGSVVVEGYGMSELPTATHANPIKGVNKVGSVGMPLPDIECRVVSLENPDEVLPVGEVGELIMHSPHMMSGYYNMPTETANTIREHEGKKWVHTGDIVRMDEDGYFYIVDRKKDMALIGGFNVYPRAVEDVLMDHPAILEAGVASIPHPEKEGQEALKAWVVFKDGESATEQELIDFCTKKLARYEVPTRFAFTDVLPRSAIGKILRRELIRMEMEERDKA